MASTQHPVFKWPDNRSIRIWRYMDFPKFVHVLENGALFFARADQFEDRFEGSYSRANEALRPDVYMDISADKRNKVHGAMAYHQKWSRKWTMINCWHMSEAESAVWKLYSPAKEAVAIQSTFLRVHECMDEKTYIGMVDYIDYDTQWMPEGNAFFPFLHKRLSFQHEREIRAIVQELPLTGDGFDYAAEPPDGLLKCVDLRHLIEAVYVSPSSPPWFAKLVERVTRRYGLMPPVFPSKLDNEPFY